MEKEIKVQIVIGEQKYEGKLSLQGEEVVEQPKAVADKTPTIDEKQVVNKIVEYLKKGIKAEDVSEALVAKIGATKAVELTGKAQEILNPPTNKPADTFSVNEFLGINEPTQPKESIVLPKDNDLNF